MRIDKLLWFLRLARTRAVAQVMAEAGHIRLNGRRVDRAHAAVTIGDVLVLPLGHVVRVVEVTALPTRRGPAAEAQACYRMLDAAATNPIGAGHLIDSGEEDLQP